MELNNKSGFTINLVLDKVDFIMVGQLAFVCYLAGMFPELWRDGEM